MNKVLINVLTPFSDDTFTRQFENNGLINNFQFYENSRLDLLWDLIIVFEGITSVKQYRCKIGGLIFISGEPPISRRYSFYFLNQFDHLITSHQQIKHKNNHIIQQCLPWHYGYSFLNNNYNFNINEIINSEPPKKVKKISIISSDKKIMPGHNLRHSFVEFLKQEYSNEIDFFGKGINPIDDKSIGLTPYYFSICIENSSINDYWTEKLADPILSYSIPLYYGCKNVNKYFNTNGIINIDINNKSKTVSIIDDILSNTSKIYSEKFDILIENRNKLLFNFNLTHFIIKFYKENINNRYQNIIPAILYPSNTFFDHNLKNYILRIKRFINKYYNYN
jgi:hypothetical protein